MIEGNFSPSFGYITALRLILLIHGKNEGSPHYEGRAPQGTYIILMVAMHDTYAVETVGFILLFYTCHRIIYVSSKLISEMGVPGGKS